MTSTTQLLIAGINKMRLLAKVNLEEADIIEDSPCLSALAIYCDHFGAIPVPGDIDMDLMKLLNSKPPLITYH